jgi:hypothetical protein
MANTNFYPTINFGFYDTEVNCTITSQVYQTFQDLTNITLFPKFNNMLRCYYLQYPVQGDVYMYVVFTITFTNSDNLPNNWSNPASIFVGLNEQVLTAQPDFTNFALYPNFDSGTYLKQFYATMWINFNPTSVVISSPKSPMSIAAGQSQLVINAAFVNNLQTFTYDITAAPSTTIVSSNPAVLAVVGTKLNPLTVGTATVTVTYGGVSATPVVYTVTA